MDGEALKLLGGGGAAGALLFLVYLVGMRIVAALDRVAVKVDNHTADDLASHADMREQLAELRGMLAPNLPADPPMRSPPKRAPTNPAGVPIDRPWERDRR